MALEELSGWLDDSLVLPIDGRKYRVPEYSAEVGLRVEAVLNAGRGSRLSDRQRQVLDDEQEKDLYRDVLGPVYDELLADVSWAMLKFCAVTAMLHFNISEDEGARHWALRAAKSGGKAPTGRASRPATRRTTAAASTTKPRASGSGTRSRRTS